MARIDKKEAAAIAGINPKTLERYISKNENGFQDRTGYFKAPSGYVYFDEQKFRIFFAEARQDETILDKAVQKTTNLSVRDSRFLDKPEQNAEQLQPAEHNGLSPAAVLAGLSDALLIPHKLFLTKKEAKALTGIPEAHLHRLSKIIAGRRLIKRSDLDKARF